MYSYVRMKRCTWQVPLTNWPK